MLASTLRLYADAFTDSARAFARSAWGLGWLIVSFVGLMLVGVLVRPLGMLGGFVMGLAQAFAAGVYLGCLQDALSVHRPMGWDLVRGNFGRYMWDIVNVLFPLWIVDLVVGYARLPLLGTIVAIGIFLFLNPVPEMIGRVRSGGTELLADAWAFMGRAGPEWLVPQVLFAGGAWALLPGMGLDTLVRAAAVFSPRMGFMDAGGLGVQALGGAGGVARAVGLVALVHLAMLFRGALYVRLEGSSRRGRAWAERAGR